MRAKKCKYRIGFYVFLFATVFFLYSVVSIPLKIAIARHQQPTPQAILTLGGGHQREVFTADFARQLPPLPIWVSTGSEASRARKIFQDAGISPLWLYLDYRATDTVTNFTTLVKDFQKHKIKHLFLITSDFHLPRAKAIANLVLGSQGITFTSISLPTNRAPEPKVKTIRDISRSLLWIFTRRTGSTLNHLLGFGHIK